MKTTHRQGKRLADAPKKKPLWPVPQERPQLPPDETMARYSIYTLRYPRRHPCSLLVFYVGMAADPYKRFMAHLQRDGSNREKDRTIRELNERGDAPIMEVECTCDDKHLAERLEAFYIEYYRAALHPLTNKVLPLSRSATYGRVVYEHEEFLLQWYPRFRILFPRFFHRFVISLFFWERKENEETFQCLDQWGREYAAIRKNRSKGPGPSLIWYDKVDEESEG